MRSRRLGASSRQPGRPTGGGSLSQASDGKFEVYVMNADGSGQRRLTRNQGVDADPTWSPDGRRIAFESKRDGSSEVDVMNADGSGRRGSTPNGGDPTWSPDGGGSLL
jgi:Tol biopolymer transport system component